jgi:hypothetical protein
LEYVGEGGGPIAVSTTASTYPWQATWPSGTTVEKASLARLIGTDLNSTASEGTSTYAARADHVHPFPSAAQVGAAPAGNYITLDSSGKLPSSVLPSYVDDVVEVSTFSALPRRVYSIIGASTANINQNYTERADQLYNNLPTYVGSNGFVARRRPTAAGTTNLGRWEIVGTSVVSNNSTSQFTSTSWPTTGYVQENSELSIQTGKIYVTIDSGKCYRYSGSTYIEISNTLELGVLQIPDALASMEGAVTNAPFNTIAEIPFVGRFNGKNQYSAYGSTVCQWTGSIWQLTWSETDEDDNTYTYTATGVGDTKYPWQATWTNGTVRRFGTYNATLAPAPLALDGYSGVSTKAAREDHVHPLPSIEGMDALSDRFGMQAHASGQFAEVGDAQCARFVMRGKTTTNSAVELFLDGSSTRLTIPVGKVVGLRISIVGTSSTGAAVAHYLRQYALKNVANTTTQIYSPITIGTDNAAGTSIAISASDPNDALVIQVTGTASTVWRWIASVEAVEIAFGA